MPPVLCRQFGFYLMSTGNQEFPAGERSQEGMRGLSPKGSWKMHLMRKEMHGFKKINLKITLALNSILPMNF